MLWLHLPFAFGGLLLLVLVVLMVISISLRLYTFRRRSHHFAQMASGLGRGPEHILARRFAMGEIDEEEYRRRLAALRQNAPNTR